MGNNRPPMWQQLTMITVSLIAVALTLWMEAPEWQRQQIRRTARDALAVAAWRSGRATMGLEIDRGPQVASTGYRATYWLSRLRDAIGRP